MEDIHVFHKNMFCPVIVAIDEVLHLGINQLGGFIGHVLGLGHRTTKEHLAILFSVEHGPHLFRHPPLGHHLARKISCPLNVIGSPCGHLLTAIDDLFGDATTIEAGDH